MYPKQAYFGLMKVAKDWGLKYTPLQVQSAMWNFSGGLDIDPKTGVWGKKENKKEEGH